MSSPKPVTVIFPEEGSYGCVLEKLRQKVDALNTEGRVVSRAHLIRYALRVAAEAQPDMGAAQQVLTAEAQRGRRGK